MGRIRTLLNGEQSKVSDSASRVLKLAGVGSEFGVWSLSLEG